MISLTHGIWNIAQVSSSMKQKQTHRENSTVVAGVRGWGGMDWVSGISRCKLVYGEWKNKGGPYITQRIAFNIR